MHENFSSMAAQCAICLRIFWALEAKVFEAKPLVIYNPPAAALDLSMHGGMGGATGQSQARPHAASMPPRRGRGDM